MKILFTNFRLAERTGSELVVVDLASGLKARGHEVAVYTPQAGPLGEKLTQETGIPVVTKTEEVPWVPEVIHGQHQIPTTLAVLAFPNVPALYYCHGYGPLEERPPVHPRIVRWLAPSVRFRSWFAREFGIPEEKFVPMPNFVDTRKFRPQAGEAVLARAKRALLYHTNLRRGQEYEVIKSACQAAGWSFNAVGSAFGGATDCPETLLPGYDVVFTSGRSALEALACGCRVMVVGEGRLGPLLTPETLTEAAVVNFASVETHGELTAEAVSDRLAGVAGGVGMEEALEMVMGSYSLDATLDRVEMVYREVMAQGVGDQAVDADAAALHSALHTAAAALAENRRETARLHAGWEETKRKREELAKEVRELKERLRMKEADGRGLWCQLRRRLKWKG